MKTLSIRNAVLDTIEKFVKCAVFLFFLLTMNGLSYASERSPCGLSGTVDERISDCSSQSDFQKEGFILVSRKPSLGEVRKELSTGLIWSDRLPSRFTYIESTTACNADSLAVNGSVGVAGITDITWRRPTWDEYIEAEKNGIRKAMPNMVGKVADDNLFWTEDWGLFDGRRGVITFMSLDAPFSVRCVSGSNT
ncbi:MAG: hypothetical protein V4596_03060 [Bdellovibrionota bacterium]